MTQPPAVVLPPPLSITCTVEPRFAGMIAMLASRIAAGGGATPASQRFTDAVTVATAACFDHLAGEDGRTMTTVLSAHPSGWEAAVRWERRVDDDAALVGDLKARLAPVADRVECGHGDTESFCRLTCSRA